MQQATDSGFCNRLLLVPNEQQVKQKQTLQHQQQYPPPVDIDKMRTHEVQNKKVNTLLDGGKIENARKGTIKSYES